MTIEKLNKEHIEDAAKIVAQNYRQELGFVPSLPNKDFYKFFFMAINEMTDRQFGVAAIQNRKLVGFLSGLPINAFRVTNKVRVVRGKFFSLLYTSVRAILTISANTPTAVTWAPAPGPLMTIGSDE